MIDLGRITHTATRNPAEAKGPQALAATGAFHSPRPVRCFAVRAVPLATRHL